MLKFSNSGHSLMWFRYVFDGLEYWMKVESDLWQPHVRILLNLIIYDNICVYIYNYIYITIYIYI